MVEDAFLERRVSDGEMLDLYWAVLTEKQKAACSMYFLQDFTLAEIGKSFGVSRQSVHDLITHSRERMEKLDSIFGLCAKRENLQKMEKYIEENKDRLPKDIYSTIKGLLEAMD